VTINVGTTLNLRAKKTSACFEIVFTMVVFGPKMKTTQFGVIIKHLVFVAKIFC
jgi:hypothetical protein